MSPLDQLLVTHPTRKCEAGLVQWKHMLIVQHPKRVAVVRGHTSWVCCGCDCCTETQYSFNDHEPIVQGLAGGTPPFRAVTMLSCHRTTGLCFCNKRFGMDDQLIKKGVTSADPVYCH